MLSRSQYRLDAVKKYLTDISLAQIEEKERAGWLKLVKDAIDEPLPVAPPRGLMGRVADVFV